jgi:murein DD-endopeptidase MepM/ murein hydrolase activator NlpD
MRTLASLLRESARIEQLLQARARAALRAGRSSDPDGFLGAPTDGYITSPFGYRTHPIYGYWGLHDGVDYGASCGAPLRAAASGTVVASYYSDVLGNRLVISHGAVGGVGLATAYNHASGYNVGVGAKVSRGQVIGSMGSTGWSTGCHLHFQTLSNGRLVNPANWF